MASVKKAPPGMGWETREPCASCPYRKDAPRGLWAPEEFTNLVAQDSHEFGGAMFGCHATRKTVPQVCGGWLLDQKRRGCPSIQLRLAVISKPDARAALDAVHDGGHPLYRSIREMCAAQRWRRAPRSLRRRPSDPSSPEGAANPSRSDSGDR